MPASTAPIDIAMPGLAEAVEALAPEQINALAIGAIRLDRDFTVLFYSDRERQMSGYRQDALGRAFFLDIAPCLDTAQCRGKIRGAMARGQFDIDFAQTMDLPGGARDVDVRIRVLPASGGGCWVFTRRLD